MFAAFQSRRSRYVVFMSGVAALALAGGLASVGVVWATSTPPSTTMISACVAKSGTMRIVSSASSCRTREQSLTWNSAGPGYYTHKKYQPFDGGAVTIATTPTTLLTLSGLPDLSSGGGGYLLTASLTLVNASTFTGNPADTAVGCTLGNVQDIQGLVVPEMGVSPGLQTSGGWYSMNRRSFTITGVYTGGGTVSLECGINSPDWTPGSSSPPEVKFVGGVITAQAVASLADQTPSP